MRGIDPSGRSGTTSSHLYAIDNDGTVYITHEHYKNGLDSDQHAKAIFEMSLKDSWSREQLPLKYTVIDSSAFDKLGLPETTAEIYERNGVTGLIPASKNRLMGWDIVHQYLRWDKDNKPKLRIFSNCVNIIRTIPTAIHDKNKPEDVQSVYDGAEHQDALDELRYVLQTLREYKSIQPMNAIERRILEIQNKDKFNYSYKR